MNFSMVTLTRQRRSGSCTALIYSGNPSPIGNWANHIACIGMSFCADICQSRMLKSGGVRPSCLTRSLVTQIGTPRTGVSSFIAAGQISTSRWRRCSTTERVLGYELLESKILNPWENARFDKYVDRGTHHCAWKFNDMAGGNHVTLCKLFAQTFPEAGIHMRSMLNFSPNEILETCRACEGIEVENRLTPARSRFAISLIERRRDRLVRALGA